ncbi:hypothetical protein GWK47_007664 [Chionoecetes opilio]|uniref:Uncharacterized protein n=1 Tax=Chionoecetes opilio TaxID=41210 RepID=A0A8J4Y6H6_CHIOP|nr:hypothetical protein GWK47_007664 [Chionoecetes opilio]
MPYAMLWEKIGQRHCLCSTVSRAATQLPLSSAREEISMGGLECLRGGDGGLQQLHESPLHDCDVNCKQFQLLERFTVIIYNKTSNLDSVNEARRELFSQKNRPMEKIPPTQEALLQHTLRAVYQAGIWATSDQCEQKPPTPEGFGWTLESATKTWRPVWSNTACSISGLQRTGQVWLQKRHVRRTMLMQEGAVEVHRTMQLPM